MSFETQLDMSPDSDISGLSSQQKLKRQDPQNRRPMCTETTESPCLGFSGPEITALMVSGFKEARCFLSL